MCQRLSHQGNIKPLPYKAFRHTIRYWLTLTAANLSLCSSSLEKSISLNSSNSPIFKWDDCNPNILFINEMTVPWDTIAMVLFLKLRFRTSSKNSHNLNSRLYLLSPYCPNLTEKSPAACLVRTASSSGLLGFPSYSPVARNISYQSPAAVYLSIWQLGENPPPSAWNIVSLCKTKRPWHYPQPRHAA